MPRAATRSPSSAGSGRDSSPNCAARAGSTSWCTRRPASSGSAASVSSTSHASIRARVPTGCDIASSVGIQRNGVWIQLPDGWKVTKDGKGAMVGAVGLTESAKGDLKEKLSQLGTNLIIAQAGGTFGSQNPTFPADAVHRVQALSSV